MATAESNQTQAQRRRAGERYRLEVQIDTSARDGADLVEYLANRIPKNRVSAFVRAAIAEKIARECAAQPVHAVAVDTMPVHATPPDDGEAASGLDMSSARRPHVVRAAEAAPPPVAPERPPFDALAETRRLLASLRRFSPNENGAPSTRRC